MTEHEHKELVASATAKLVDSVMDDTDLAMAQLVDRMQPIVEQLIEVVVEWEQRRGCRC